ncbi:hypothetical protein C3Y98_00965 [Methylotenera oryzisoli]|uniref:Uncharacterized protein n=1 Tax=Methylotenera oryzisoli TaxID=2080758 RepID=A0A4Y9VTK7_9PROT|nr:hypothetical protein C3Y98_00965 [Methylotenera oryzisoli]
MELIIASAIVLGISILTVVILRSEPQLRAVRICLAISILGWVVALAGITYAGLFVSNKLIYNPHISYSNRIIFQLISGTIGGFICFLGVCTSIVMLQNHGKNRILLAAIILGLLYVVVPIFWLFF